MFSNRQIITFVYDTKDFNFVVNSSKKNESLFDSVLQQTWKQAEKIKVFRYILNIKDSKILKGKYRFLVQVYLLMCKKNYVFYLMHNAMTISVKSRQSSV